MRANIQIIRITTSWVKVILLFYVATVSAKMNRIELNRVNYNAKVKDENGKISLVQLS